MSFETMPEFTVDKSIAKYYDDKGFHSTSDKVSYVLKGLEEMIESYNSFITCLEQFMNHDPEAIKAMALYENQAVKLFIPELPNLPFPFIHRKDTLYFNETPVARATVMAAIVLSKFKLHRHD